TNNRAGFARECTECLWRPFQPDHSPQKGAVTLSHSGRLRTPTRRPRMCILNRSLVLVSIGALALGAGFALPGGATAARPPATKQPEKKPAPPVTKPAPKEGQPGEKKPGTPSMEEMMKAGQPGPEHKILETMLGNWEGDVKFWM